MTENTEECLFCKIVEGIIWADKVYEDDKCLAFKDINPQAPVHILLIPKKHIARVDDISDETRELMGYLIERISYIAKQEGLSKTGFRTVINCGEDAGQVVWHLHLHLLGGRALNWPPG